MAAPGRLIVRVGPIHISAIVLPDGTDNGAPGIVCKACAPNKTKMRRVVAVQYPVGRDEQHFTIYQCAGCDRQWALPWLEQAQAVQS